MPLSPASNSVQITPTGRSQSDAFLRNTGMGDPMRATGSRNIAALGRHPAIPIITHPAQDHSHQGHVAVDRG
jgi:hypothetical protein